MSKKFVYRGLAVALISTSTLAPLNPVFAAPIIDVGVTADPSGAVQYSTYVESLKITAPDGTEVTEDAASNTFWLSEMGTVGISLMPKADIQNIRIVSVSEVFSLETDIYSGPATAGTPVDVTRPVGTTGSGLKIYIDNVEVYSTAFKVDGRAPTAEGAIITGDRSDSSDTTYLKTGSTVRMGTVKDDYLLEKGSGFSKAVLEHTADSGQTWSKVAESTDLAHEYPLSRNGQYRFTVYDVAGNEATFPLSDLAGTHASIIISPDAGTNAITHTVNGAAPTGQVYADKANVKVVVNSTRNIMTNTITVNGKEVTVDDLGLNSRVAEYDVDLSKLDRAPNGDYIFTVTTKGLFSTISEETFTVKADFEAPTIDSASLVGDTVKRGSTIFATGPVSADIRVSDSETGIKSVVAMPDNGEAPIELKGTNGVYNLPIKPGVEYIIAVTDNAGHVTEKSLTDLGVPSKIIVIDSTVPDIKETTSTAPDYTSDGQNWYKSAPILSWTVAEENILSVTATVNGQKVELTGKGTGSEYTLDTSSFGLADGNRLSVEFAVEDAAGNITVKTGTYFVDDTAPTGLSGTITGDIISKPYGNFSKTGLGLKASASDGQGSGVAGYRLLDANNNVIADTKDGSFTLGNGSYGVVAYDHLGNESERVPVSSLAGLSTNNFHVDAEPPTINVDSDKAVLDNWYSGDVNFSVGVNDNVALDKVVVTINGKTIEDFTATKVDTGVNFNVSTKGIAPNKDGSYVISVSAIDAAGNRNDYTNTVRIDNVAPEITGFTFTSPGYKEGESIAVDDKYGFYFQDATGVRIAVSDADPSSGIKSVSWVLHNPDGSTHSRGISPVNGGYADVTIPVNFKGYISATATDNVGNVSDSKKPSGVITEDRNWYVNTSSIDLKFPGNTGTDSDGNLLFNSDVPGEVSISSPTAGIRSVEWGVGDDTRGTASVSNSGEISARGFNVVPGGRDKNLVTSMTGSLPIDDNANGLNVWVKVTDRAGHTSEMSQVISVDKDAPIVDVSYNTTNESGFYNTHRTATVTVKERNFDPSLVDFTGTVGRVGTWKQSGDTWVNTVTFDGEQEYQWGVEVTDKAGNKGTGYSSEQFTIDTISPRLDVTYNTNDAKNEFYYNAQRVATVTVVDRNFDPSRVTYSGDGIIGGWSSNGDTHTARVEFASDGEYAFSLQGTDKANNSTEKYDSGKFIVDTTKPILEVKGAENGVSYKKDMGLTAKVGDTNLDTNATKITVTGRTNGPIKLKGGMEGTAGSFSMDNLPKKEENDDLYTVNASAVDKAGNIVTDDRVFSVNRFGSKFSFVHEDYLGKYYQRLPKDVVLTQESVDRLALDKYKLVVLKDGQAVTVPRDAYNIEERGGKDSKWQYVTTVNKDYFNKDAVYQVQTFSELADGTKESSMDQEYSFVIDDTDPEVIISGIESGGRYTGVDREVLVEIRDLSGPQSLEFTLNGEKIGYKDQGAGTYVLRIPSGRGMGLSVHVVDRAGNETTQTVDDVAVSATQLEAAIHNPWVWAVAALTGIGILVMLGMLLWMFLKRRSDEKDRELYQGEEPNTSGGIVDPSEAEEVNEDPSLWPDIAEFGGGAVAGSAVAAGLGDSSPDDGGASAGALSGPRSSGEPGTEDLGTTAIDEESEPTNVINPDDESTGYLN